MECPLVINQYGVVTVRAEGLIDHNTFIMEAVELLDFHKEMQHIEFLVTLKGCFGARL